MATYPGVQDKLAAELEGAGLLATRSMPEPRDVDFNVIHELPVLDAVSPSCHPDSEDTTSASDIRTCRPCRVGHICR